MGFRIYLIPSKMESGNMLRHNQAIRLPAGSCDPSATGWVSKGDPLSKKIREKTSRSSGTVLSMDLIILSEIKCVFNLKSSKAFRVICLEFFYFNTNR